LPTAVSPQNYRTGGPIQLLPIRRVSSSDLGADTDIHETSCNFPQFLGGRCRNGE